ncbi:MAG: hypothetical protein ACI8SC_000072 [Colwellia sp.]|jgi:hypothetical protein
MLELVSYKLKNIANDKYISVNFELDDITNTRLYPTL